MAADLLSARAQGNGRLRRRVDDVQDLLRRLAVYVLVTQRFHICTQPDEEVIVVRV
jgi:phosphoenolpyruvate-protein kinase (PTS system EI component)